MLGHRDGAERPAQAPAQGGQNREAGEQALVADFVAFLKEASLARAGNGPVRRFKLGAPEQFTPGSETLFSDENLVLFRDDDGFYAISTTCTHLGCTVPWRDDEGQFHCPCHGSKYNGDGSNVSGPAPKVQIMPRVSGLMPCSRA